MNSGALIWMIIFAVAATGFFVVAAVVAVRGFFDLRLLLRHSNRGGEPKTKPDAAEENFLD